MDSQWVCSTQFSSENTKLLETIFHFHWKKKKRFISESCENWFDFFLSILIGTLISSENFRNQIKKKNSLNFQYFFLYFKSSSKHLKDNRILNPIIFRISTVDLKSGQTTKKKKKNISPEIKVLKFGKLNKYVVSS